MKIKPENKKKIIATIKDFIIAQLKGAAVKMALKAALGTATGTGVLAWVISFIVEEFMDQVAEPIVRAFFLKIGYAYSRIEGKIIIKRIQEARENNDGQAYDHAVDDIFIE